MEYKIIPLSKEDWAGTILPMNYTTTEYYDVSIEKKSNGFSVKIMKKPTETPIIKFVENKDISDRLYAEHWEGAYAWGIVKEGQLLAAIETCPEKWSRRLRVTELWVDDSIRRQGIAHRLMLLVKEQARRERCRAVILETQSCNAGAIGFYLQEGFILSGFDRCCYSNHDIEKKEVRLEMGYFLEKNERLTKEDVIIRREEPADWFDTELMTKRAFWNKYHRGCDEHYLVHKLRNDSAYLPELSRIAVKDGKIIGAIFYAKSCVKEGTITHEVVTFGPLCVDPEWQGSGVGEILLRETMPLVKEAGYPGIIILGEPDYYPRIGFQTCDHFGITTNGGQNFDAFMGIEVIEGGFAKVKGDFCEAEVFDHLPAEEVEKFNERFPYVEKQHFPGQWD